MTIERLDILGPLAVMGMSLFAIAFVLVLVAIGLTPFVVDRADHHFAPLMYKKNDPQKTPAMFKVFPLAGGLFAWYGMTILMRRRRYQRKWPFAGRPDRVRAIEEAPTWLKHIMVWVYLGFVVSTAGAFIVGGIAVLFDKFWF
ncbi:hypothetical protein [Aidingimonas halophila]|uniref:Uncharacterized protein n=1 Tax=Aidingimonas halophila TaxID=574349 RepID=A0A1H2ZYA5_9GAMM|nr:hypothetical protein [Aidingimonas halophila]GHC16894.1 hypothetical protein GCM10008094_02820 [Aidingimonas halophila]SDX21928.1 hypothetical protein SAMN05443545_104285 [Aidingimonas halophila]